MTSSETTFNDEELLLWLRLEDTNLTDFAADRIEQLTEQLAVARQDAEIAEEELEMQEQEACMMENDYLKLEKERDDYAHKLMQANNTYTEMHLEIERLSDKLAKAVAGLEKCQEELDEYSRQEYPLDHPVHGRYRQRDYDANTARVTLAEISSEAALNKGETHDPI